MKLKSSPKGEGFSPIPRKRTLNDSKVNAEEWAKYRQDLRDVTGQKGFPQSVEWPARPSVKPVAEPPKK